REGRSYSLKRFGGIPALCARPSKSTCRFVRLPQKRERGRTRSSDLGGSRVLCARPPKSKCRFVRLPQKRERGSRRRSLGLFAGKNSEWNDHFLQGNAPMLECVQIILNKLVVIVLIYKILIFLGKNVTLTDMLAGQQRFMRIPNMHDILCFEGELLAGLVSQVCVGIAVADHFAGCFYPDGPVVGRNDESYFFVCNAFERIEKRGMFKP